MRIAYETTGLYIGKMK